MDKSKVPRESRRGRNAIRRDARGRSVREDRSSICAGAKALASRGVGVLLLFLALGIAGKGETARPQQDPEYVITQWTTMEGLPESSATSMAQTADGYLWFGTFNGLVRFDGVKFTVHGPMNTPALPHAA